MESKKISFGFSKVVKKPQLLPTNKGKDKESDKVELIKCLEGQEIKLLEEKPAEKPLIIPLKENTKTSAALASLMKRRAVLLGEADEPPPNLLGDPAAKVTPICKEPVEESLEHRAARELLASVQQGSANESVDDSFVVPALKPDELPLDGAKPSSIDDYESVPIEQFGKAMLRGMGWIEPAKKKGEPPADEHLFVRPKGMGLGADKALKKQPLLIAPEKNELLEIKKLAYVRILGGKHKSLYGQIEGFDDHAGRVIVKMAIGGAKEAFNEFLCQPVSKKEYTQYGKCINTTKYEEYKKMENEHGQIIIKKEDNIKSQKAFKEEGIGKYIHERNGNTNNNRSSRHNALDEDERSSSRQHERHDEHRTDEYKTKYKSKYNSKHQSPDRANSSSSSRQPYSHYIGHSSDTDSNSDAAHDSKHKKKSSHKSKSKKKSNKKSHKKERHPTDSEDEATSSSDRESSYRRKKKSKKLRSRSRSYERKSKR